MTDEHVLDTMRSAINDAALIVAAGRHEFLSNKILQRAAKNIIAELGEASASLSQTLREQHTAVPWKPMMGMRHKVVHDYAEVDLNVLWDTLLNDLPALSITLKRIRER